MTHKQVATALAAWNEAVDRSENTIDGDAVALQADIERTRDVFQQLSAEDMIDHIGALHQAERRRKEAIPSTPAFHQAAKDEKSIADEIWESARMSDEDSPQTRS